MTEKEKCRQGLLYDANYDRELLAERERAKELLYDYNRLRPSQYAEKTDLLRSLLGKVGKQVIIEPPFNCDYGYNIEVGENFYANVNLVILDGAKVTIGDNAFIAPNVGIYTQVIRWMPSVVTRVWSMLIRYGSGTTFGLVLIPLFFPVLRLEIMW